MITKKLAYQHLDEYCQCMKQIHELQLNENTTIEDIITILLNEYYENQELFETFCGVNASPVDSSSLYYICEDFYNRQSPHLSSVQKLGLNTLYELTSQKLIVDLHNNRFIDSNTTLDSIHLFNEVLYKKGYKTEEISELACLPIETIVSLRSGKINLSDDELLYLAFTLNFTLDEYALLSKTKNISPHRKKSFEACIASRTFIKRWENNETISNKQLINDFLANQPEHPLDLKFQNTVEKKPPRNLLIVGASGFIGSNAAKYFKDKFDKLVLFHHSHHDDEENICYCGDCNDAPLMEEILLTENITHVLFLAGYSIVSDAEKNRPDALKNGSSMVVPLLERIVANNLQSQITVIAPSTIQVYEAAYKGEYEATTDLICHENIALPSIFLTNTYALTKITMESNIWRYIKLGCKIGIPRLANIYGPNDIDKRLIPIVIKKLLAGENPQVKYDTFTKCSQSLNFIHINDCLKALDLIFTYYDSLDEFKAKDVIFNIASNETISVEDIVIKLRDLINPSCEIEYGFGSYDTRHLIISNDKISHLGFKPSTTFEEGITDICTQSLPNKTKKLTFIKEEKKTNGK